MWCSSKRNLVLKCDGCGRFLSFNRSIQPPIRPHMVKMMIPTLDGDILETIGTIGPPDDDNTDKLLHICGLCQDHIEVWQRC